MVARTIRVETSMPGWTRGSLYTVDDDVPLIAALIAAGRMVVYVPPVGQTVGTNPNDVIRLADLSDPNSPGALALKAAYVPREQLVLAPTAPTAPAAGTVWINTSV